MPCCTFSKCFFCVDIKTGIYIAAVWIIITGVLTACLPFYRLKEPSEKSISTYYIARHGETSSDVFIIIGGTAQAAVALIYLLSHFRFARSYRHWTVLGGLILGYILIFIWLLFHFRWEYLIILAFDIPMHVYCWLILWSFYVLIDSAWLIRQREILDEEKRINETNKSVTKEK